MQNYSLDGVFTRHCLDILTRGSSDEGLAVRPKWADGTPAHTKMIFNQCTTYPLSKNHIPILTLRKTNFRACVDEILWIYQKTSNNIRDLNSHIWDSWADEHGSIGKTYGYQIAQRFRHHKYIPGEDLSDYPSVLITGIDYGTDFYDPDPEDYDDSTWVWMNQIDAAIYDIRNNPTNRGIITNMFNHRDLADMGLRPCAYSLTFNVETGANGTKYLHALLNQRSQDMITANGWNVTQYSVLVQMIAQVCGMRPGSLTHMVANMHIYDRHEEIAMEMIKRYQARQNMNYTTCVEPMFHINPEIKSFKDFTAGDVWLENYIPDDYNPKIEVAV